jgi:hypothetical protein
MTGGLGTGSDSPDNDDFFTHNALRILKRGIIYKIKSRIFQETQPVNLFPLYFHMIGK